MRLPVAAWCVFVLAVAALGPSSAQQETVNVVFAWKETLKLDPQLGVTKVYEWKWTGPRIPDPRKPKEPLVVVKWNRNCWRPCKYNLEGCWGNTFYQLNGDLDTTAGTLTMNNIRMKVEAEYPGDSEEEAGDGGSYTLSYNTNAQCRPVEYSEKTFEVKVYRRVPKPVVSVEPEECHRDLNDRCTLICNGNTKHAGAVNYSWKIEYGVMGDPDGDHPFGLKDLDEDNKKKLDATGIHGQELIVGKNGNHTAFVEVFYCEMSNLIPDGQKRSDWFSNPFFKLDPLKTKPPTKWFVGPISTALSFTIVPVFAWIFRWLVLH